MAGRPRLLAASNAPVTPLRLPDLGPRGEGWFLVQCVLLLAIAAAALVGPDWFGPWRVGGIALGAAAMAAGGWLAVRGVFDLGGSLTVFPRPRPDAALVRHGAYRRVRHPIYGGLILGAAGWGLAVASWPALAGAIAMALFFDLKSRREEVWLVERFADYPAYRERTTRLLPWIY